MRSLGLDASKELLTRLQENRTEPLDFDEFLSLMTQVINDRDIHEEIMRAFKLFDTDGSGKITMRDIKNVAEQLGEKISDEELHEMIKEADLDKDGSVDASEFLKVIQKTDLW